jgi:hypothetical protein
MPTIFMPLTANVPSSPTPQPLPSNFELNFGYNDMCWTELSHPPIVRHTFVFFCLESLFTEMFGGTFAYYEDTRTVVCTLADRTLVIPIDDPAYIINGYKLDTGAAFLPIAHNGRVYVELENLAWGFDMRYINVGHMTTPTILLNPPAPLPNAPRERLAPPSWVVPEDRPFGHIFLEEIRKQTEYEYLRRNYNMTYLRKSYDGIEYIEAFLDDGTAKPLVIMSYTGSMFHQEVGAFFENLHYMSMYAREGFHVVAVVTAGTGEAAFSVAPGAHWHLDLLIQSSREIDILVDYFRTGTNPNIDASKFAIFSHGSFVGYIHAIIGRHKPAALCVYSINPDFTARVGTTMPFLWQDGIVAGMINLTPTQNERLRSVSPAHNVEAFLDLPIFHRDRPPEHHNYERITVPNLPYIYAFGDALRAAGSRAEFTVQLGWDHDAEFGMMWRALGLR